jgi:enterochelin esterase-like enzyme
MSAGGGAGTVVVDPGTTGDGNITVGPTYTPSPDLAVKNVPHSAKFQFTMTAAMSKIFMGTDAVLKMPTPWTRQITVFIPKQYVDGAEAPFIVMQDGNVSGTATPRMVTVVENLAADPSPTRRIPPLVVIFVPNGGGDGPGSERGLEYDTASDRYSRFINTEVLPAVQADSAIKAAYPNFKLTTNPEGRGAYGCSSGSPAAFGLGWFADFHRIITYSGTFVDLQQADAATEAAAPNGAWDYASFIMAAPTKPLRVFLEAADKDNGNTETEASHHNWLIANQNMAAALKAKGYHYRFVYALGAGHCDDKVQQQTLPDTVSWMWNSYQP